MRANFSPKTREDLAKQAGYDCVMPHCGISTHFMSADYSGMISVANTAHASGASPGKGSIRYDETLTDEQRKSADNGAHLCPNHAMLIDKDPDNYTVKEILSWQKSAAEKRQWNTGYPLRRVQFLDKDSQAEVTKFLKLANQIHFNINFQTQHTNFVLKDFSSQIYQLYFGCKWNFNWSNGGSVSPHWKAGDHLHAHDPFAYQIQVHILACVTRVLAQLSKGDLFHQDENGVRWYRWDAPSDLVVQSKEVTAIYIREFQENRQRLYEYMLPNNATTSRF